MVSMRNPKYLKKHRMNRFTTKCEQHVSFAGAAVMLLLFGYLKGHEIIEERRCRS
jgi:hypothetical protein